MRSYKICVWTLVTTCPSIHCAAHCQLWHCHDQSCKITSQLNLWTLYLVPLKIDSSLGGGQLSNRGLQIGGLSLCLARIFAMWVALLWHEVYRFSMHVLCNVCKVHCSCRLEIEPRLSDFNCHKHMSGSSR